MGPSVFKQIQRVAWHVVAASIILTAILNSGLRLLIPRLAADPARAAAWLSEIAGLPVSISGINTGWYRGLPRVIFRDIGVHAELGGPEIMHIGEVDGRFDVLTSLLTGQFRMKELALHGLSVGITRRLDGTFVVEHLPMDDPRLLRWALAQPSLRVTEVELQLRDEQARFNPTRLAHVDVTIHPVGDTLLMEGHAGMVAAIGAGLDFRVRMPRRATPMQPLDIDLVGQGVDLRALLVEIHAAPPALEGLRADLRLSVTDAMSAQARIAFEASRIDVHTSGEMSTDQRPTALALRGIARGNAGLFDVQLVNFAAGAGRDETIDWRGRVAADATPRTIISADRVPLALLPLLKPWLATPATINPFPLADLGASGTLTHFVLGLKGSDLSAGFFAAGDLHGISLTKTAPDMRLEGLSARFALSHHGGALRFEQADFAFAYPARLQETLRLAGVDGGVRWDQNPSGERKVWTDLAGFMNTLPMEMVGSLRRSTGAPATVDLDVHLGTGDLSRLHTLVPLGIMRARGDEWLRTAFPQGILMGGDLSLHGPLAEFPFAHNEGRFKAEFAVEDVLLVYAAGWPHARDVSGVVKFDKQHLSASLTQGKLLDSSLKTGVMAISDYLAPDRTLSTKLLFRTTQPDVMRAPQESPLIKKPLAQLGDLTITGPIDLTLDLGFGLFPGGTRTVQGSIAFTDNLAHSTRRAMTLEHLNGQFQFTQTDWHMTDMMALLGTQHVAVNARGHLGEMAAPPTVELTGTSDAAQILGQLRQYAPSAYRWLANNGRLAILEGAIDWRVRIETAADSSHADRILTFESNLAGLRIGLPAPLGKTASDLKRLQFAVPLAEAGPRILQLRYGEQLALAIQSDAVAGEGAGLQRLEAIFGGGQETPTLSHPGIYLHGHFGRLPLGDWATFLQENSAAGSQLPVSFAFDIDALQVLGQEFAQTTVQGQRDVLAWRIRLDNPQVAGQITVPRLADSAPITLDLDRLWLNSVSASERERLPNPRTIPALAIACASFRYNTLELGQASLATRHDAEGLRLNSLIFQGPDFQIRADGNWFLRSNVHTSQFNIHLAGASLGKVLTHFGYNASGISGGQTAIDIEATWPGTPGEFTLDRLNGRFGLHVQRGRLLDLEPGSGRLFGLLSLQMLPRRLSLDFGDLFHKGYSFDHIEGQFALENGNAYTNSLLMEGPASRVEVTGRTGLASHDYDQRATVTPSLSSSIPIASALFGPAGIGVGAAIYLGGKVFKGIPREVDRMLQKHYAITGPWTQPKIEAL